MLRRLRRLYDEVVHGERLDRGSREELRQHLERAAAERIEAGAPPAQAWREARLELGDPEEARERLREGRTGYGLEQVAKDLAYTIRLLRKRPGFSAVCVLTIALGVGASTALFAVVDAVLLKPLPLPEPGTLLSIYDT